MSTNFNHSDLLQGYDMMACITAQTINKQLAALFEKGIIQPELDLTVETQTNPLNPNAVTYTLQAQLAAPTIQMLAGSDNARMVEFSINMASGSLGVAGAQQRIEFKNWRYVFNVNLDMQALALNDAKVPPEVEAHLEQFDNEMFTVNHLFMDFEDADLASFNKDASSCPLPGGIWGTGDLTKPSTLTNQSMSSSLVSLQLLLRNYFTQLKGSSNPYILGYAVTRNKDLDDDRIPPTFNPTGCNFSITYDKADPVNASTLNFLLMTQHSPMPGPNAGLFDTPWVSDTTYAGRFIIGGKLFLSDWLLPKLKKALDQSTGGGSVLTPTSSGWTLASEKAMAGIPRIPPNEIGNGTATYTVDIIPSNSLTTGVAKVDMTGKYHSYIEWRWHVWPLAYEVDAWADQAWTASIELTVDDEGQINSSFTQNLAPSTHDYSKNGPAKFLNIVEMGTLRDFIDGMGQASAATFGCMAGEFGTDLQYALQTRFVMPAGPVFHFSNLHFDNSGDIISDIDYTSAASA